MPKFDEIERNIDYEVYSGDIVLYKDKKSIGGKKVFEKQGISTLKNIEEIKADETINCKKGFGLYKKEVLEIIKNNSWHKALEIIKEKELTVKENVFDIFKENKDGYVVIINNAYLDGTFLEYNGKLILSAIEFDFERGQINDGNYDLEEILEKVIKNKNCVLLSDGIIDIPYYNKSENKNSQIEFKYIPGEKDRKIIENKENVYDKILKNIILNKEKSQ